MGPDAAAISFHLVVGLVEEAIWHGDDTYVIQNRGTSNAR